MNYGPILHEDIYDLEFFGAITTSYSKYIKEIHSFENSPKCKKFLQKLTNIDMLRVHISKADVQKLQNEKNITILHVIECFGFSSILYLLKLYEYKKGPEKEIKLIIPVYWKQEFHINLPCIDKYRNALTFSNEGWVFLQICLCDSSKRDDLSFGGGKIYCQHKHLSDDKKINKYINFDPKKEKCIDSIKNINIALLTVYYTLVLNAINRTLTTHSKSVHTHKCKCPEQKICEYLDCNKNCIYPTVSSEISGIDPYTIFSIKIGELVDYLETDGQNIQKLRKKLSMIPLLYKMLLEYSLKKKKKNILR